MTLAFKIIDSNTPNTPQAIAADIQRLLAQMQADQANLASLQDQLAALKAQKNPPATQAEIDAKQKQVDAAQSTLDSDTTTDNAEIASDTEELACLNLLNQPDNSVGRNINKIARESGQKQLAAQRQLNSQVNLNEQENDQSQVAQERASTFKTLAAAQTLDIDYGQDALVRLGNIVKDQEAIDADQAQEKVLKDEIIEDSIKAAALWIFGGEYYAYKAKQAADELNSVEDDESNKKADLAVQQAALSDDLSHLFAASEVSINNEIQSMFTDIQKIISIVQKGGNTEADFQQVSNLLAEVMSIVQMICSQIQQLRSVDDQWQSRANSAEQEISANKSKVDEESAAALAEFASFMKTVMAVAKYGGEAASVAGAVFTGGATMIAFAAIMVIATESGLFDMATNALANQISKSGAIWAKVLADVIVTVATIVVTHSASAAVSKAGSALASALRTTVTAVMQALKQGTTEAVDEVEIEMANLTQNLGRAGGAAAGGAAQAGQNVAQSTVIQRFVAQLKNTLNSIFSGNKQNLGFFLAYSGATGTYTDFAELCAAIHTGQAGLSKDQLEQQEMFQIIQMVMALVTAIVEMVGTKYAMSGSGTSALGKYLEANLPKLLQIMNLLMIVCAMESSLAAGALVSNDVFKGKMAHDLGSAESNMSVYKTLGEMQKLYDQKQIELFASKLQQMIEETTMMINKFGQAENEVAKLLEQSAV